MPSERRLHPLSFLFTIGRQLQYFLLPGLVVLFTARSGGMGWEMWGMLLVIPAALASLFEYWFLRYRYDEDEIVIRSGMVFRNERHIPYARIQNIDARQNVLHRLLGVAEVKVETGGGQEPEAKLTVLPLAAFEEMWRRVFAGRPHAAAAPAAQEAGPVAPAVPEPEAERVLLRLSVPDLALAGLIEGRGMILVAAAFGLLWELRVFDRLAGGAPSMRHLWSGFFRSWAGRDVPLAALVGLALAALVAFLIVVRLLSVVWSIIRLHGFTLSRAGDDLRTRYGLFTRVTATIPLRRVQALTVHEGPWHRWAGRAAVRVDTAGGGGTERGVPQAREWIAPLVRAADLSALLQELLPGSDPAAAHWQRVSAGAFRRELRQSVLVAAAVSLALAPLLRGRALLLFAALGAWSALVARRTVDHLGYAMAEGSVLFRSGWLWRDVTVAPFAKIQAVALNQSPFDRRRGMAGVRVDTAGAAAATHRVHVPYLDVPVADALFRDLLARAAGTALRW